MNAAHTPHRRPAMRRVILCGVLRHVPAPSPPWMLPWLSRCSRLVQVVVISPCADGDALCMRLSERCAMVSRTLCPPELLALALGLGGEQSRAQAPLVELADSGSILPVALLLGECHPPSCEVGVLPGVNVPAQVHHITVGTPFQDPGGTARPTACNAPTTPVAALAAHPACPVGELRPVSAALCMQRGGAFLRM